MQNHGLGCLISDKLLIKALYRHETGKRLNLKDPQTFNEKLQWLKLYCRRPGFTQMVDKYAVKQYVSGIIGEEKVIPTLAVWDDVDAIDILKLPDQFVLKCTHDSGGIVLCENKAHFDLEKAKVLLKKSLQQNFYYRGREWPYKNVKPRIICEPYLVDESTKELRDYKFFCFDGKVKFYKIDFNRFVDHRANYYDAGGDLMPFGERICPPDFGVTLEIPNSIHEMIVCAEKLSANIPFVRVDLYYANQQILFGEMTFFPASGFGSFIPEEWDNKLGELIRIQR